MDKQKRHMDEPVAQHEKDTWHNPKKNVAKEENDTCRNLKTTYGPTGK